MGGALSQTAIDALVNMESPDSLPWEELESEQLFLGLGKPVDEPSVWQACSRVCKNNKHAQVVWTLADVALSAWGTRSATNTLGLLRVFITFVTVERIPLQFLYHQEVPAVEEQPQSFCFHRLVPVVFHFQGSAKTVYMSIPQTQAFDFAAEQQRLLEEIRANFEALLILGSHEQLLLLDAQKNELDVSSLVSHYTDYGKDQLVDPFSDEETVHKGPLHIWLETAQCTRGGRMTRFLHSLVDNLLKDEKTDAEAESSEAAVRLMIALLSSHLYAKTQSQDYATVPKSPALQIFHLLPPQKARKLVDWLLKWFLHHYEDKPQDQPTLLSRIWRRQSLVDISKTNKALADVSLQLALLLVSYQRSQDFDLKSWSCEWERLYKLVIKHQSSRLVELLFVILTLENDEFFTFLVSRAEPESLLEPLCRRVFEGELQSGLYLELLLVMRLSEDHLFTRFLFADIELANVAWIPDYHVTQISLGSLLFFTLLQSLKGNLTGEKEHYLHVLANACLFNLSENVLNLHEVPSMSLLSLIKVMFTQWKKKQNASTAGLLTSLLEVLVNILKSNVSQNPKLVYSVLHYAYLFDQMAEKGFAPHNVAIVRELTQHLLADLDTENIEDTVTSRLRVFSPSRGPAFEVFGGVAKFKLAKLSEDWEPFLVPYVWTELLPLLWKPETTFLAKTRVS